MASFIEKLITLPLNYFIIAVLTFFYTLESYQNTALKVTNRLDHLFNNLLFHIGVAAVSYVIALLQVHAIQWINAHHFGLLNQLRIPFAAKVVIGIACLDFTVYWFHRLSHKSALLWRLHRVHHSDTSFDASTFFRHHPLEVIVSATASVTASAVFGLDIVIVTANLFLLIPCMIAQHSNIRFPVILDKVFGKLVVTPNLHKLHHAQDPFYTDSNFADIFIFWDRLFGTYKPFPDDQIIYGLKEFDEEKKQSFWFLLKSPFVNIDR